MVFDYQYLIQFFVLGVIVIMLIQFIKLFKTRVSLKYGLKKHMMSENAFIHYPNKDGDECGAELRLSDDPNAMPVGRVLIKDDKGWVSILKSRNNSISDDAEYLKCGCVDDEGYIYAYQGKKRDLVKVGYLARPSAPNVPTLKGERSWKSFWLKSVLNAYYGEPGMDVEQLREVQIEEKKDKQGDAENYSVESVEEHKDIQTDEPINEVKPEGIRAETNSQQMTQEENLEEEPIHEEAVESSQSEHSVVEEASTEVVPSNQMENIVDEQTSVESVHGSDLENEGTRPLNSYVPDVDDSVRRIPEFSEQKERSEEVLDETADKSYEEHEVKPEAETVEKDMDKTDGESGAKVDESADIAMEQAEVEYLNKVRSEHGDVLEQIKSNMIRVEGGSFKMGADPATNKKSNYKIEENEHPVHTVTLDSYYIGKYPITQKEWTAIMGNNPSAKKGDDFPVAPVTWNECNLFAQRLSKLTGLEFSLPTEAQWEYAARGGKKSQDFIYSGSDYFNEVGWKEYYVPVGKKKPNELGIYDMSGLVREWCYDWYEDYEDVDKFNPKGPEMPENEELRRKVVRCPAGNETVSNRKSEEPNCSDFKSYGFRIACSNVPKEKEKQLGVKIAPTKVGEVTKFGFGGKKVPCGITDEARAGAFSVLYYLFGKRSYEETYADSPYGWLDTALLSSLVYTVLYLLTYIVNSCILEFPMYDNDHVLFSRLALTAYYFLVWTIVRYIKIACAESGNSFQPILDLFNKSLGLRLADIFIILICIGCYFDIDFIPMIWAVLLGVVFNMLNRKSRVKWEIDNPYEFGNYSMDSEFDEETGEYMPPRGEERRDYKWSLKRFPQNGLPEIVDGELALKFHIKDIEEQRLHNPFFCEKPNMTVDEKMDFVDRMVGMLQKDRSIMCHVRYLSQYITKMAVRYGMSEMNKLQFALDFVQAIRFEEDKNSEPICKPLEYFRFPDETLYDKEGDCDCKSLLAMMIYHEMGYDVKYLISDEYEHVAVAVAMKTKEWEAFITENVEDVTLDSNGQIYIFCETVNQTYRIGQIATGQSITKFDVKRDLFFEKDEEEE